MTEIFRPAQLSTYLRWLDEYLANGGRPTHLYDYPWAKIGFLEAVADFSLGGECGVRSRSILVHPGVFWRDGALGHNALFYLGREGQVEPTNWVPYFADPAFRALPHFHALFVAYEARQRALDDCKSAGSHELEVRKSDLTAYLKEYQR